LQPVLDPRIGKGTVSLALRIFTLALLLGWQAVEVKGTPWN
jgi:hypothetical protein